MDRIEVKTDDQTNVAAIQVAVDALVAAMLAKGLARPEAEFTIRANADSQVGLSWTKESAAHDWDREYEWHRGAFADAISKANAAIEAMPDRATRNKAAFMERLDEVIALGRKHGIEVEYVNPLVETMKRLSENIITHAKAGA